ncbi:hypothetical protein [Streptomyces sp. NPDC006610]|uniref:hypothetical protein n=1 Tax=Streptomyces sp. NPDC006610 TaxID=3154584 RepID=UPI0033A5905F
MHFGGSDAASEPELEEAGGRELGAPWAPPDPPEVLPPSAHTFTNRVELEQFGPTPRPPASA